MWQNTGFMLGIAWKYDKSVIFLCIALAMATAGVTITELLIAPMILQKVETLAPLGQLVVSILGFSVVLMVLSGLKAYLTENTLFGRVDLRTKLMTMIAGKDANTLFLIYWIPIFSRWRTKRCEPVPIIGKRPKLSGQHGLIS